MATVNLEMSFVSAELDAAKRLKEILDKDLSKTDGEIWLIPSFIIPSESGQRCVDLDLIFMGYLKDYHVDGIDGLSHVSIASFFTTIEIKCHSADSIHRTGTHLFVDYSVGQHDATSQSENQKQAVQKYMATTLHGKDIPIITNLIWLVAVDKNELNQVVELDGNILAADSTANDFFVAIGRQSPLIESNTISSFRKDATPEEIRSLAVIMMSQE